MGAGSVRQGQVYVEIGADPTKFFAALNKINRRISQMGRAMSGIGASVGAAGLGMAAPFIASIRAGAKFEDTLLNIRASTNSTAAELQQVRTSAMDMSAAMGIGPTKVAGAMLELLKAGMKMEDVLGGAGKAAIEFATVGQMDIGNAAVVMSDAMNVFGVSANEAANAISSAADGSSTSIEGMAQAFSMSSAVAALANQSIQDLSGALAILANNGVKGSDAGTSVKTMLLRIMAPAEDGAAAMREIGLSINSFRNADGKVKPMVEIIRTLTKATEGMDNAARDDIFRRIFGSDAIRAASIFANVGVAGFEEMSDAMKNAMPVAQKFKELMGGLTGAAGSILAAMERLGIAISDALGGAIKSVIPPILGLINGLTEFAIKNKDAVANAAKFALGMIVAGGALTGLGISLQLASFAFGGLLKAAALVVSPIGLVAKAALFAGSSFTHVGGSLALLSTKGVGGVLIMATRSGLALSRLSAGFGVFAGQALIAGSKVAAAMTGTALAGVVTFARAGLAAVANYAARSTAILTVAAANSGRQATAQVAATVSVISASIARAAEGNARAAAMGIASLVKFGSAGVANAMVAAASIARASAEGGTALAVMGARGASAVARIGTTAIASSTAAAGSIASVGASAAKASTFSAAAILSAVGKMIAGAAATSAAWVAGFARMTAASVASGAVAAGAFLLPFAGIAVAIAAAVATFATFKNEIFAALAPVGDLVSSAASAISGGFNTAVADGAVVFSDLYATATTTFNGIYEAISNGDLSGAMDVLWKGLVAGWLRGTEAIMGYVDSWITSIQNVFTDMGTGIAIIWDSIWTTLATTQIGAAILGVFDNIANSVMATWDWLVGSIQKGWIRVQSLITGAKDADKRIAEIDDANKARAEQRRQLRPGVEARQETAKREGDKMRRDSLERQTAMGAAGEATKAEREAENKRRADARRAATVQAEGELAAVGKDKRESRARAQHAEDLGGSIGSATTMEELRALAEEFHLLREAGRLTTEQEQKLGKALDDASERITQDNSGKPSDGSKETPEELAKRAGDFAASKVEAAGTFSSFNLGGMGFGGSLQERIAKATEDTARGVKNMGEPQVAA